jgi:hypothetical protein
MHKFNAPVRTAAERTEHKDKLNEIFAKVGSKGRIDSRGLKQLNDNRVEIAETIVQLIQDDLTVTDPTPFLVEPRTQGFTDRAIFQRLEGTLSVVSRSYGSKPLSQRITASEFSFSTSMKEIAVEIPLEEVVGGRVSASQVVEAMAYAIGRYKVSLVLDAIDAAVTATADHTGLAGYNLRYLNFTEANLQKAIDGLQDDSESPTIFGRHIALYPAIRNFSAWSPEDKSMFTQRGQVGEYLGAPIVTLVDRYARLLGGHQIAANRVWVAAASKGAWMIEKDVTFLNWAVVDERTATFATGIRLENGVFVHNPHKYRVLEAP